MDRSDLLGAPSAAKEELIHMEGVFKRLDAPKDEMKQGSGSG